MKYATLKQAACATILCAPSLSALASKAPTVEFNIQNFSGQTVYCTYEQTANKNIVSDNITYVTIPTHEEYTFVNHWTHLPTHVGHQSKNKAVIDCDSTPAYQGDAPIHLSYEYDATLTAAKQAHSKWFFNPDSSCFEYGLENTLYTPKSARTWIARNTIVDDKQHPSLYIDIVIE